MIRRTLNPSEFGYSSNFNARASIANHLAGMKNETHASLVRVEKNVRLQIKPEAMPY
jgi:hypothetical protein